MDRRRNQELVTEAPGARPVRVLRIIARLNVGGPARHVVLLDRGLRERRYDTLLVHGSVGPGEASLEHLAGENGVATVKVAELGPRIALFGDLRALAALISLTFRTAPDVIHTHTAKAGTLGRIAALVYNATRSKSRRALVVHTFHGHVLSGYFGSAASALVRMTERCLSTTTDCIVTLSPSQREDIVKRFHVASPERTVIVPLGLDLLPLLDLPAGGGLRSTLGIRDDTIVVGFVGRFVPIKNLPLLIVAFAKCARQVPNVCLLLAGDGPLRGVIEQRCRDAGIADRVRLVGWTEDLPALYATIDICALSSINEGTPVAAIEAMAAGKPVVATAVGGVPDVIEPERTGLLVPSNDVEALAQALIRLSRSPQERLRLGQAARRDIGRRYSSARLAQDIDELYKSNLAKKRG